MEASLPLEVNPSFSRETPPPHLPSDLSPLSYIAGTITGNPAIRVFDGPKNERRIVSSKEALAAHGITPLQLGAKEPLGILNGTGALCHISSNFQLINNISAFSASVGSLALSEAAQLALLAQVCTAMGTEVSG